MTEHTEGNEPTVLDKVLVVLNNDPEMQPVEKMIKLYDCAYALTTLNAEMLAVLKEFVADIEDVDILDVQALIAKAEGSQNE